MVLIQFLLVRFSPESLNIGVTRQNLNRAIVNVTTEEVSDKENYIIITRANVGDPNACPEFVSPKDFSSPWLLVIDEAEVKLRKSIDTVGDACLTCLICGSSIYYINMEVILNAIRDKFLERLALLKKRKEDLLRTWLKTMVALFNEQKAALCCALENCQSRTRNVDTRRYIETQRIAAAASDFQLVIGDENDKLKIDTNFNKDCAALIGESSENVTFGDCNVGECSATITLDASIHSHNPNSKVVTANTNVIVTRFFLPAGLYQAEITSCCAAVSPGFTTQTFTPNPNSPANINALNQGLTQGFNRFLSRFKQHTGRVSIQYAGLVGGQVQTLISTTPDLGTFISPSEAANAYLGTTVTFDHQGGELLAWVVDPDNDPSNNTGNIEVCIKEISCLNFDPSGSDVTGGIDRIYVYRNNLGIANFVGVVSPYQGDLTTQANYGLSGGNANITFGPPPEEKVLQGFCL